MGLKQGSLPSQRGGAAGGLGGRWAGWGGEGERRGGVGWYGMYVDQRCVEDGRLRVLS